MSSRKELLTELQELSYPQFEEVLFRLKIEPWNIPGPIAEQNLRAQAVIRRLEQERDGEGIERLKTTLADPAIKIIDEQYIGYEIEAQVKQVISEYTQQPFEGREEEKHQLDEFLKKNASGILLVPAAAGFGKSALLSHWQQTQQEDYFIAYHCFSYRKEKTRSVFEAYRHLLKQLYYYHNIRNGQFPNDEGGMRDTLMGMLSKPVSQERKPLVIVLDGLDEAEKTFEPFFNSLPAGVFVIASARAEEDEIPEYLRNWTDNNAQSVRLKRLPPGAISKWLEKISELATYSQNEDFVKKLDKKTHGFPLYLRFLIDDLRQAATKDQDVLAVLKDSPGGFKTYVKEQFRQLAKVEEVKRQEVQELFALLSVALGALSEDDIQDLTSLTAWDLADLPWQATRWFSIQMGVYSFAHPLLANEFRDVLGREASLAEGKLIDYCAKWSENNSAYALRHYAKHLEEVKRWEELYALARDENFASAQQQQLPDEPDLSLKTVQTTLLGAAEEDKAEIMAEFLLLHAHRLWQTNAQESPLKALRSGNLKRAWVLADQFEIERSILWYLLLAWELKDESKLDKAKETLKRLQQKDLPRFLNSAAPWQSEYTASLLAYVFEVSEETCIALHKKLFPANTRHLLCDLLLEQGNVKAALKITEWIILELRQVYPLPKILKAQVEKGNSQETKAIFAKVLEITRIISSTFWRIEWMGDIAKVQIEVGHREEARATFTEAIENVYKIENPKTKTNFLIKIADFQADVELFSDARETLRQINFQGESADFWEELAKVQEKIGDSKQAQISYGQTKQIDINIEKKIGMENQEEDLDFTITKTLLEKQILIQLVSKYAENEQFNDAFVTVNTIKERSQQEDALKKIAEVYIRKENFTQAWKIVNQLYDSSKKLMLIQLIAARQAQVCLTKEARDTLVIGLNNLLNFEFSYTQAFALLSIAEVQLSDQKEKSVNTVKDVYEIAKSINNLEHKVNVLSLLGEVYAKAGQRNKAKDIFTEAIKIAEQIEQQNLHAHTNWFIVGLFITIGITQARAGEFDAVLETVQKIQLLRDKALVLKTLAQQHPEAEQKERLKAVLTTVYEEAFSSFRLGYHHPVTILSSIAVARMELGEREVALAIFVEAYELIEKEKMEQIKTEPDSLLSTVVVAEAEAGCFDNALKNASKIQDGLLQVKALGQIASLQWKTTDKEKVLSTLDLVFRAKQNITDEQKRIEALWLIAQIQVMGGEVEEALRTAEQVLTYHNQLLYHIGTKLAELRDKDNFKKLLTRGAYSLDTAYNMCECLAYLYPEKAESVAEAMKKFIFS